MASRLPLAPQQARNNGPNIAQDNCPDKDGNPCSVCIFCKKLRQPEPRPKCKTDAFLYEEMYIYYIEMLLK